MADMVRWEQDCFDHFIRMYDHQWKLNDYFRTQYDEDLSYYLGYRDATKYPLAYNESFNKLLPRIMQTMSRFMDQLYQPNSADLVSVRPRLRQNVESAKRVSGLLNFQLETLNDLDEAGGSYLFNFQWMLSAVAFGKGIAKLYWRKEERITPRRIQMPVPQFDNSGRIVGITMRDILAEMPQVVYDQPYAEVIHPKLFIPHPHYKSIQKMPAVFCIYKRPLSYLKEMEDKGIYRNIDKLGWPSRQSIGIGQNSSDAFSQSVSLEGALTDEEIKSDRITPMVDVLEGYGRYIFPEDEMPYEVGSGIKIKGKESEAIVHIGNYKTLLSVQKNKYGSRPFMDMGAYYHPELYWDIGLLRLGKGLQEQYDTLGNLRLQNAMMLVNQMIKVRQDSDIDPASLIWKPYGIIPVEDMNDVEPLLTNDVSQTGVFREQEQFLEDTISDMTGMYKYSLGQTPSRQEAVGTVYSLQKVGEARIRLMLMTMDYQGFRPFLKYMMTLNTFHLPPDFETRINNKGQTQFTPLFAGDIHSNYDFTARYTAMEPALGKQFRADRLLQLSNIWQQNPALQQYEWTKTILELMDVQEADSLLKSPQEMQQEQMMAAQQAAQAHIMQATIQDQMDAKHMQRHTMGKVIENLTK